MSVTAPTNLYGSFRDSLNAPITKFTESIWRRGWSDTKHGWANWRFILLEAVGAPAAGAIFSSAWLTIFLVIFGMFSIWIGATAKAPFKQRDEARNAFREQISQHQVSDTAIDTVIAHLRASLITEGHSKVALIDIFQQLAPSIIASQPLLDIEVEILGIFGLEKQWRDSYTGHNALTKKAGEIFSMLSATGVVQTQTRRSIQSYTDFSRMSPSPTAPSSLRSDPVDEVVVVMTALGYQVHQKLTVD